MEAKSVPIQEAMKNGKPTCIEFYTEWCKDCKVTGRLNDIINDSVVPLAQRFLNHEATESSRLVNDRSQHTAMIAENIARAKAAS
jgi:thiol-disulfide isomerase/thioredoxin